MEQWHTGQSGVAFIFYTLMKDPAGISLFKDFLKVHGNLNALNFVLDVFKFRSSPSSPTLESRNVAVDIS
jgi:hypothetical protein